MKSNDLSWSPTFPTSILLASEDHNLYTFDIRRLGTPTQIYKAHVSAVTSCDWSPTGTEFVSGGWDRTLRIWQDGRGTHPEVYHTKRMQRVLATTFTSDARFVLSGSEDGNVRIWKADASEKLGIVTARERSAIEYRGALKERWKMDAEIGKVQRYARRFDVICSPRALSLLMRPRSIGVDTYQSPCTRLHSSSERWKRLSASRRRGGGGTRARARPNPRRSGRKWSSRNRASDNRCVIAHRHEPTSSRSRHMYLPVKQLFGFHEQEPPHDLSRGWYCETTGKIHQRGASLSELVCDRERECHHVVVRVSNLSSRLVSPSIFITHVATFTEYGRPEPRNHSSSTTFGPVMTNRVRW